MNNDEVAYDISKCGVLLGLCKESRRTGQQGSCMYIADKLMKHVPIGKSKQQLDYIVSWY